MQEDSCPEYMQKAEDCLRAEEGRVGSYLHVNTKGKLMHKVLPACPPSQEQGPACP